MSKGRKTVVTPGAIERNEQGLLRCEICGAWRKSLARHIGAAHGVDVDDYRYEYGLYLSERLTSDTTHEMLSNHAKQMLEEGVIQLCEPRGKGEYRPSPPMSKPNREALAVRAKKGLAKAAKLKTERSEQNYKVRALTFSKPFTRTDLTGGPMATHSNLIADRVLQQLVVEGLLKATPRSHARYGPIYEVIT